MSFNPSDIVAVLSGGSNNTDPQRSVGGNPSSTPVIKGQIRNLFPDISRTDVQSGLIDHRCVYLFNDSDVPVYNVEIFILAEIAHGSSILIGVDYQNESQRITVSGSPTGGTFDLAYNTNSVSVAWGNASTETAQNIEQALNSMMSGSEHVIKSVHVASQEISDEKVIFDINFIGYDGYRFFDTLYVSKNLLVGDAGQQPDVVVESIIHGSPINTIAPRLDIDTTVPGGVEFRDAQEFSPIVIPRLMPMDGFPLWFQRITERNATEISRDGFAIRIRMTTSNPF